MVVIPILTHHIIDAKNAYLLIEIVNLLLKFPIFQNM